ncbi:hypothetical protein QBC44DRAFT_320742 [Cladorrhinum sp. PSN332]|nr:hypothetical protein QBC44DRAFT_320742 [Cladorrhinum sp. PSN332]
MPSILFNGRLVNQSRRCLFRKFHTGQGLLAKPPPTPRFQKPGSSPKENLEKISAAVEPTGAPKPTLPRNFDEVARPARAPQAHAPPRIVDTSSKEYKQAERKWVSVIVALPILFVTSYFLFDRRECKGWLVINVLPILTCSKLLLERFLPAYLELLPRHPKPQTHCHRQIQNRRGPLEQVPTSFPDLPNSGSSTKNSLHLVYPC